MNAAPSRVILPHCFYQLVTQFCGAFARNFFFCYFIRFFRLWRFSTTPRWWGSVTSQGNYKKSEVQRWAGRSAQIGPNQFLVFLPEILNSIWPGNSLDPVFKLWYSGCDLNDAFQGGIGKFFFNPCDINSETKYFVDSLDKVSLTDLVGVKGYNINTAQQSLKWKNEGGGGGRSLIKTAILTMVGKTKRIFFQSYYQNCETCYVRSSGCWLVRLH